MPLDPVKAAGTAKDKVLFMCRLVTRACTSVREQSEIGVAIIVHNFMRDIVPIVRTICSEVSELNPSRI